MLAESLAGTPAHCWANVLGNEYRSQQVVRNFVTAFGLAAADQLMVDLGVMNQTAFL
jgi:hypothetical protein